MAEINLDALQQEAEKLVALLKVREIGLATWWSFLSNRLRNLQRICGPVDDQRLMRLVCALHGDAGGEQILSEGQIAAILQCDRVEVRRLWQEAPNREHDQ